MQKGLQSLTDNSTHAQEHEAIVTIVFMSSTVTVAE